MSSVEGLREFVSERLTAAAEEIFQVFQRTIVEYEEEILRQRKMLDIVWKPHVKLQRIDVSPELKGDLDDQQLCNQERDLSLDQDRAEIKEEPGQSCISHEGEQLLPKPQTDMVNFTEESDKMLLFLNSDVTENQGPFEGQHEDKGTITDLKSEQKTEYELNVQHSSSENKPQFPDSDCNTRTRKKSFRGDPCGKSFNSRSGLQRHMTVHKGETPYSCKICGKILSDMSAMKSHLRIHTGEKPFSCTTCGKNFRYRGDLTVHMRTHTGERPYLCKTCGREFRYNKDFRIHLRIHTGEKPYPCSICGKTFRRKPHMQRHLRIHTGEKVFTCETCGRKFRNRRALTEHTRIDHTGRLTFVRSVGKKIL